MFTGSPCQLVHSWLQVTQKSTQLAKMNKTQSVHIAEKDLLQGRFDLVAQMRSTFDLIWTEILISTDFSLSISFIPMFHVVLNLASLPTSTSDLPSLC